MNRDHFFGSNPAGVLVRLVLLSVIVGIVLSALGISLNNLFYNINVLLRRLYDLGFGAIESLLQYFLIGALIVFPIWFVARLIGSFKRGSGEPKL